MNSASEIVTLKSESETGRLGETLAGIARPGDCFLLRGQIGVGKSTLARAFIRALTGAETEVPSPTFTLVQIYEHDTTEIWHADLYRLGDPQEAVELGLTEAFETAICLIEWPELLGNMTPETALDIHLNIEGDAHVATLTHGDAWLDRLKGLFNEA